MKEDYTTYPGSDMYDESAEAVSQPLNDLLLPCPFCGNAPYIHTQGGMTRVVCDTNNECGVHPYVYHKNSIEAMKKWNNRAA